MLKLKTHILSKVLSALLVSFLCVLNIIEVELLKWQVHRNVHSNRLLLWKEVSHWTMMLSAKTLWHDTWPAYKRTNSARTFVNLCQRSIWGAACRGDLWSSKNSGGLGLLRMWWWKRQMQLKTMRREGWRLVFIVHILLKTHCTFLFWLVFGPTAFLDAAKIGVFEWNYISQEKNQTETFPSYIHWTAEAWIFGFLCVSFTNADRVIKDLSRLWVRKGYSSLK